MHWIRPSVGSAIFGFGLGAISDVALCAVHDPYQAVVFAKMLQLPNTLISDLGQVTGEAFIGIAFIRNCFSIAIFFALVPWLKAHGLQNMSIVNGAWTTAVAFLHIPLIVWGKRIRERTADKYQKMVEKRTIDRL
jgi:hypothetical protein